MGKRPEGRQGHLERGDVPHGLRQPGQRLTELLVGQEGIEQVDVWHPALHIAVILAPNRLNRLPDVWRWYGHHRGAMGLRWHTPHLRSGTAAPREMPVAACRAGPGALRSHRR